MRTSLVAAVLCLGTGCSTLQAVVRFITPGGAEPVVEPSRRREYVIPGLQACEDGVKPVTLDPSRPVHVLVHGCNSSTARFKTLAQVFEASGQQTVCYSYNDRDYLERSSARLAQAIEALKPHLTTRDLVILGHSQGGLIARKALVAQRRDGVAVAPDDFRIRLVTVSSPFGGIRSSRHCGSVVGYVVSFGITVGACQIITGAKWREIFPGAGFIRTPGALVPTVAEHVKVDTDEAGSCRRTKASGECAESDFVFGLEEQYQEGVDKDARALPLVVKAGHVEIVGETGEPPVKLIALLRERGILATPPLEQQAAFAALLEDLYR